MKAREGRSIKAVVTALDIKTRFQSWDLKIAEGLLSKIPEGSSFHTELAMRWRAIADKGGIQRGRVLFAR